MKICNFVFVWLNWSNFSASQVEVPDGKSICPDPDERTTGVSCVQIYMVWKQGKMHESHGKSVITEEHL